MRLFTKLFSNREVRAYTKRVISEENIDLVYTLQIAHYLHPAVILAAHDQGVPTISRLSDFYLLAPCYTLFKDQEPCELCLNKPFAAWKHRCLKNSSAVTLARIAAMRYQKLLGADKKVSCFLTPTKILQEKMLKAGFPAAKIRHLPTFVSLPENLPNKEKREAFFLYSGNLLPHKGLLELLAGLRKVPSARLLVAGDANIDEAKEVVRYIQENYLSDRVELLGMLEKPALDRLYRKALAVVIPSIWYENLPNVLLEAVASGAPVLVSNIGSLTETVVDGETGLTFDPFDPNDVARVLQEAITDPQRLNTLAQNAFDVIKAIHSPESHYRQLNNIFESALKKVV